MNIYRAYITYNNGDYNEWEEVYRAESPWYTSREEAEKHFFELARLRDWLRYSNRENSSFRAEDPQIEVKAIAENGYSPMEVIAMQYGKDFELRKFCYIEETPSLEVTSLSMHTNFSYPGVHISFKMCLGEEEFSVAFSDYIEAGYHIVSTNNKKNRFFRYTEQIQQLLINTVKEKLVDKIIQIAQDSEKSWGDYHNTDGIGDEHTKKWHIARVTELRNAQKICTLLGIIPSKNSVRTLVGRFRDIKESLKYNSKDTELYAEELACIKDLLRIFDW